MRPARSRLPWAALTSSGWALMWNAPVDVRGGHPSLALDRLNALSVD